MHPLGRCSHSMPPLHGALMSSFRHRGTVPVPGTAAGLKHHKLAGAPIGCLHARRSGAQVGCPFYCWTYLHWLALLSHQTARSMPSSCVCMGPSPLSRSSRMATGYQALNLWGTADGGGNSLSAQVYWVVRLSTWRQQQTLLPVEGHLWSAHSLLWLCHWLSGVMLKG